MLFHRELGNTGLRLPAISLACSFSGVDGWARHGDEQAVALVNYAHERGITFLDCAAGDGRAETVVGQYLKTVPRDSVEIASNFDCQARQDISPAHLRRSLGGSLKTLGVDCLDLYMAHGLRLPQLPDDLFEELEKIRAEGKVRAWGVSLGPAIGWRDEGTLALTKYGAKAVQTAYNLFEQSPGRELRETALATKAGVLAHVYGRHGLPDQDAGGYGRKKIALIQPLATKYGMTIRQLACKWLLQQPRLTSVVTTPQSKADIDELVQSTAKPDLSNEDLQWLAEQYAADFGLGEAAHPCDLGSSVDPSGFVRSRYVPPPVYLA
jgi:aryl-alcohol dehydrogenase-like predicted oxidoreductase